MVVKGLIAFCRDERFHIVVSIDACIEVGKEYLKNYLQNYLFDFYPAERAGHKALADRVSVFSNKTESMRKDSAAQLNQDLWVINFFNHKTNGYYIDIGANDGITYSNTYILEKYYNWTGLLIEPSIKHLHSLAIHRPISRIIPYCVLNKTAMLPFFEFEYKSSDNSTLHGSAKPDMFNGVYELYQDKEYYGGAQYRKTLEDALGIDITINTLPCFHVQETLDKHLDVHRTKIDYLSIDAEGAGQVIVEAIDWQKLDISFIHIEAASYDDRVASYNFFTKLGYAHIQISHDMTFFKPEALQFNGV